MVGRAAILGAMCALGMAALAGADVLVSTPDPHIGCGQRIQTGVWYQSFSGGPRNATIHILSAKRVLWSRHVRATTTWRYWRYHPRCGRTYYVRYSGPWGPPYSARVRVAPSG
jgi:hypothetical protein